MTEPSLEKKVHLETGELEDVTEDGKATVRWTFYLSVRSDTIVWTTEMIALIEEALNQVPDIKLFGLHETYGDV